MLEIFSPGKFDWVIFFVFFIPGFISIKIWSLIIPSEHRKIPDYILEAISYSCFNYALLSPLIILISKEAFQTSYPIWTFIIIFLMLFVFPIIWPILFSLILSTDFLKGRIVNLIPNAWDHFFGQGEPCWVLITLKNGKYIGGLYREGSFASSYPNSEDIYISEVWSIDDKGEFKSKIENTKGMWISKDAFDYIEFFEIIEESEDDDNG